MKAKKAFRRLRDAWFWEVLYEPSHVRESEFEKVEILRRERNKELKRLYDLQTEAILEGKEYNIAPRIASELED